MISPLRVRIRKARLLMTTVLVVEDEPAISGFISAALEDVGYQVAHAVDGAALQLAHDLHPDVILLDMAMPGMDGKDVSIRLHADPETAHIPIIGMSAGERLALVATPLIDDRLPKPFGLDDLYAVVERWAPARD